jgi:hypothetical protein
MTDAHADRPDNRETEYEDLKPVGEGEPPRTATEPRGAEGSERSGKTRTDPASGQEIDNACDPGPKSLRDTPKVG